MTEPGRHPEAPRPKPDHDTIDPEEQARKMMGQDEPTQDYTEAERKAIEEDMTQQNPTQTDAQTFEQRVALNYPEDMLKDMTATRVGVQTWQVLSIRSGEPAVHTVDIKDLTCTCDAEAYQDGPCAHLAYVLTVEDGVNLEDLVAQDASYVMKMAETAMGMAEGTTGGTQTEEAQDAGEEPEETDEPDVAPNLKAGELKNAFDDVVDDMRVEYTDHYVWVQTGPDSPDWAFEKFLQDPEQTYYIPDDYSGELDYAAKEKPGQWWKNAIKPEAVDEYINGVLK